MVRRFVQEKRICTAKKSLAEQHAKLEVGREGRHLVCMAFGFNADATEDFVLERVLADEKVRSAIGDKKIVDSINVPGKLVNLVVQ